MKIQGGIIIGMVLMAAIAPAQSTNGQKATTPGSSERETVLDRKVHIASEWIKEIPEVPRLCDQLGLKKQKVNIGDCELYCDEEGSGLPIVLLHGGPGATHHGFHPVFSRATNFAQVIYYDQRGCGLSDYKKGSGYTTGQAVDDLEKLRIALKIDKWIVAGHSYGGYVAQNYTVKYPDHLAGLVLIGAQEAVQMQLGSRQYDYISKEERQKISAAFSDKNLTPEQRLFNAHLFGDWKRQNFYRPTNEDLARMVKYEWVHDPQFRSGACATITPNLNGFFDTCPIPILIMEGKWDLTWSADKPRKMQVALPKSKLVVFEKSSHSPFSDEPELFFAELKKFIEQLPKPAEADLAAWKKQIETMQQSSPAYVISGILSSADGWGSEASKKIAQAYKKEWLKQLQDCWDGYSVLNRLGYALYDAKMYADALAVFKQTDNAVWQGHVLDLLGKREEAVACYQQALKSGRGLGIRQDQYGLELMPAYVKQRIEKPFVRVENNMK